MLLSKKVSLGLRTISGNRVQIKCLPFVYKCEKKM